MSIGVLVVDDQSMLGGLQATREIIEANPEARILILATRSSHPRSRTR